MYLFVCAAFDLLIVCALRPRDILLRSLHRSSTAKSTICIHSFLLRPRDRTVGASRIHRLALALLHRFGRMLSSADLLVNR